jgi:ligand-binding sensor domain-containing protein
MSVISMGKLGASAVSRALALLAALALLPGVCAGAVGDWTLHVVSSNLYFVFSDGGDVWSASSGGAVRYTPGTGEFSKVLRDRPGALVSNELSCVAVTDGGREWYGTRGFGLNLREAGEWTLFTAGITPLPSNEINCLASSGGSLWVGTTLGLALVEGSAIVATYTRASTGGAIPNDVINDIVATDDTVWCATSSGVGRGVKVGGVWNWTAVSTGLTNLLVICVAFKDGGVWVASGDGTYELQGATWVKQGTLPMWRAVDLQQAGADFYAAAGDSGVLVWQGGDWVNSSPRSLAGRFRHLTSDAAGNLWCAASTGLVLYDGSEWNPITFPGPQLNHAEDLSISPDGAVWAATRSGAAALKYDGSDWTRYDYSNTGGGFQDAWLFSVFAPDPDTVWFGHCCLDGTRVDRLTVAGGVETWSTLPFVNAKDIIADASGKVWFSSDGYGIYTYDPSDGSTGHVMASVGRLASNSVEAVAPVGPSRRWVGHMVSGVDYWDDQGTAEEADDRWKHFSTSDGLASSSVTSMVVAGAKAYAGTLSGVSVFQDTLWLRNYTVTDLAPASDEVNDVAVDGLGNLWVATTAGVARIRTSGETTVYTYATSGLVSDQVLCVAVDDAKGEVWFGTPSGMAVLEAWESEVGRNLSDAYVFPNPLRPASGSSVVRIGGLPSEAEAWVYDLGGRELRNLGVVSNGDVLWDGTDSGGAAVPTGVYLITLKAGGDSSVCTVAVIR